MSVSLNPSARPGSGLFIPLEPAPFLRRMLWLDASITFVGALPLVLAPALLGRLCNLPEGLLFWTGLALLPLGGLIAFFASRRILPPAAAWLVIVGNALYTLACAELLLGGWVAPNGWGMALLSGHGLLTLILAELEYFGLRKTVQISRA